MKARVSRGVLLLALLCESAARRASSSLKDAQDQDSKATAGLSSVGEVEQHSTLSLDENWTWVEVDMEPMSEDAAAGESRSLLSLRERVDEEEEERGGKFGLKFGKFGGKFGGGKFGKFGGKFGPKFGKFGKFGGKFGKHGGGRRRKYYGGGGRYRPHRKQCNTRCGANEWNGYRFNNMQLQLQPHECAYCEWQMKGLSRCGHKTKLIRLDLSKACCAVKANQPQCTGASGGGQFLPGQGQAHGARTVQATAQINGPGTQNYYEMATGRNHMIQVPAGVYAGQLFSATIY